jgi:hypothetical protein
MESLPSDAARALGILAPDRWREARERQQRMASMPRIATVMRHAIGDLKAMRSGAHGDFVNKGLVELAAPLFEVMERAAQGRLQRSSDQIVLGSVPDDETGASMSVYPDGSGLMLFSDSLLSVLHYFAGLVVSLRGRSNDATPIGSVAVRYHILHRRLFGLSAMLGVATPPGEEYPRDSLAQLAIRFVLAHEAAHFCLGHDARHGDPAIEFEADELALQSVLAELEGEVPSTAGAMTLVSMRIALLATEMMERGTFIRAPTTHPPAANRWERGTEGLAVEVREGAELYSENLAAAVTAASDATYRLPETWWGQSYNSDVLETDVLDSDYYASMRHLDHLGFGDPNDAAGALMMCEEYFGIKLFQAANAAADGSSPSALVRLGVSADRAQALCDEFRPLAFFTLLETISQSPTVEGITDERTAAAAVASGTSAEVPDAFTLRQTCSWCLATLMAGIMQGTVGVA